LPVTRPSALLFAVLASCGPFPRDPHDTLARVAQGTLRVGVSVHPPWVLPGPEPVGVEPELVGELAEELGVEIEWHPGSTEALLARLEGRGKGGSVVSDNPALDLVIGGLCQDSPWRKHVAFSLPYADVDEGMGCERVLAMPPGENAWAMRVDSWIATRSP
jgi:polar amino acid transport system substrate-binding protein